jgi:autonomous glycyl radical cofactor GrcA
MSMSTALHHPSLVEQQSGFPVVHLSYDCIQQERSREAAITLYEIACSITYPTESAHLSIRVSGQHTYRNAPAREVPSTRHEAGATTYVELLEREQLEVRIVEHGGAYAKAVYYAHGQALTEQRVRRITSTLQRIDAPSDIDGNGNAD